MTPKDASRVIEFVADDKTISATEDSLHPLMIENDSDKDYFSWAVSQGKLESLAVYLDGQPVGAIWFRVEGVKLTVAMCKSIVTRKIPYDLADQAFVQLALSRGCKLIEGKTRRRSHVCKLQALGWLAESINVVRKLY